MSDAPHTPAPIRAPESPKTNGNDAASPQGEAVVRSTPEPIVVADTSPPAVEEVAAEPKPKTVMFRDLELELPTDLPGTVAFDWAEIEDGKKDVSPVMNLIKSIIGRDQFNLIYEKVGDEGLGMEETLEAISKLSEEIFASYGTSLGESQASDAS